jgi:hypothetical protein
MDTEVKVSSVIPVSPSKWLSRGKFSSDIERSALHVLAYGLPKTGKTSFIGTWPAPVVIDADKGMVTLRNQKIFGFIPEAGERTFADVCSFLRDIKERKSDFAPGGALANVKTVAIDTITRLSELLKDDAMLHPVSGKVLDPSRDKPEFDHWGFVKSRLGILITLLHEIPLHSVVTAWVEVSEDDVTGMKVGLPKTEGKYREVMAGRFDEVYYFYTQSSSSAPTRYFMRTQPYGYYIGGSRLKVAPTIENPSYDLLEKALRERL